MSVRVSRALRALIAILALALAAAPALADSIEVKLNASAKIYQSASSDARSVKAAKSLRVTLEAYGKGWGRITYKGRTGYIKLKYLDRVEPLKAYVMESATVYKDADASEKLTDVSAGAVVYVVGVDGGYVRVQNSSGTQKGYIKAGVLSASKSASGDVGAAVSDDVPESLKATAGGAIRSKVERAIFVAQALVGAPHSDDPNPPKSFDCASFTWYCYGAALSDALKGSAKAQGYDDRYDKIAYGDLKRGDLVCFDIVSDDDLSDHVGIYLGGGYFLHASSAAKKVILSTLDSGYYKRTFSWGRRIFNS